MVDQIKQRAEQKLVELVKHKHVMFTDRCNSAIFIALEIVKNSSLKTVILIPDQGGWFSYKKYPKYFGFEVRELKTDRGVIDLDDLRREVEDAAAIVYSSLAGYYAEQDREEIATICREVGCLIVEDVSGIFGSELVNQHFSDIMVGSFGVWKPLNIGFGGFIACREKTQIERAKDASSLSKVPKDFYRLFLEKLLDNKIEELLQLQQKVKKDLSDVDVFHRDRVGVNVVTEYDENVIEYCRENEYDFLVCPKSIRVNEKAISIELKRLDFKKN